MLFPVVFSKNWEFRTASQTATCDDRLPCINLRLPPYTIITHSIKRRQLIEPICAILSCQLYMTKRLHDESSLPSRHHKFRYKNLASSAVTRMQQTILNYVVVDGLQYLSKNFRL
ncbi:hypothetical protein TNCV_1099501 [Trichonephila clavipes]|nr:hypothetical protein TNCV_1099501 [Trichonephila clavipes]